MKKIKTDKKTLILGIFILLICFVLIFVFKTSMPEKIGLFSANILGVSGQGLSQCQTSFKMAYIYLYEPVDHIPENLERLKNAKPFHEEIFNKAGRGKITTDLAYPIVSIELTASNRDRLLYSDKSGPIGNLNIKEITKEFYKNNPDNFDFISIYTNFFVKEGATGNFSSSIQNKLEGIGRVAFDYSNEFGSQGELLGWNFLGNINHIYSQDSLSEFTEKEINCMSAIGGLVHETLHQWGVSIGDQYGGNGDLILQNSWGVHWFQGLNIGYDPLGGGKWRDNNDGSFTSLEADEYCASKDPDSPLRFGIEKLSDLTLYLIGAIDAGQVEPILWINYNGPLQAGTTVTAEKKYITIQEIITRHGAKNCTVPSITSPSPITLLRVSSEAKVYKIVNNKKMWIPTAKAFVGGGYKWENIQNVNQAMIDKYTRLKLARRINDPKVYYLTEGGLKRWIPTVDVFNSYYNKWNDVIEISADDMNMYPDSNLIRLENGVKVYKLENGQKRWIKTAEAFNRLKYDWTKIAPVNQTELNYYPEGSVIE